ncbi:MAG: hypothetical protein ACOYY2_12940 [Actinomycetota bacterium]
MLTWLNTPGGRHLFVGRTDTYAGVPVCGWDGQPEHGLPCQVCLDDVFAAAAAALPLEAS